MFTLSLTPRESQSSPPPFKSNWDYRRYMQQHGHSIMKSNALGCMNNNPFPVPSLVPSSVPFANTSITTAPPSMSAVSLPSKSLFLYKSVHDPQSDVAMSDLQKEYLATVRRKARMAAPSLPTVNFPSQRGSERPSNRGTQA